MMCRDAGWTSSEAGMSGVFSLGSIGRKCLLGRKQQQKREKKDIEEVEAEVEMMETFATGNGCAVTGPDRA
jgi:hypothetical protein